ncbi:Crp/Fnr family transcriptional regulator [Salisediminibacterium beveridgei]|uniref:Carbon monoxide-responsive transcriptional activator CooA n=1 Tax=Salisediminibacterium beveridgei TaxID=632773 RepID=A0A1D7QXJ2_9BACI|nr:Crp/Fnr family transcriptional regulator [Salisediminibacterium beveridgei]AOM83668.1 Carbon monoxide-responsive transcriptional activator CooA [Salisediminibacterium beveridgei]
MNDLNKNSSHLFQDQHDSNHPVSSYEKRAIVFHSQSNPDHFYYVKSGSIKVSFESIDGQEYTVVILSEGDIYSGHARGVGIAIEDTELQIIPKETIITMLQSSPVFAVKVLKLLGKTLHHSFNIIEGLVFHNVQTRIIYTLVYMAEKSSETEKGKVHLTLGLTQEEIAAMVGCSRQTVNQILKELQEWGWISLKSRKITILEIEKLYDHLKH